MIELLLVDDEALFRGGLRRLLEADPELHVRAEALSAEQALEHVVHTRFDVVVTDLTLPERDGLWLVRRLREEPVPPRVVVVSMHEDPRVVDQVIAAGAAYLLKTATPEELRRAVHQAAGGAPPQAARSRLSLAEVELLHLARKGLEPAAICSRLALSDVTFRSRVRSLCRKLQSVDLAAAVDQALEDKLLISDTHG